MYHIQHHHREDHLHRRGSEDVLVVILTACVKEGMKSGAAGGG